MKKTITLICALLFVLFSNANAQQNPIPNNIHNFVIQYEKTITVDVRIEEKQNKETLAADMNGFYIGNGLAITAYQQIFYEVARHTNTTTIHFDTLAINPSFINMYNFLALPLSAPLKSSENENYFKNLFLEEKQTQNILYTKIYFVGMMNNVMPYYPHIGYIYSKTSIYGQEYYIASESVGEFYLGAPVWNIEGKIIGMIAGRTDDGAAKAIILPLNVSMIEKIYTEKTELDKMDKK